MSEYDDREFDLVLPFKCVASVGGPYDDQAFVAGFAAGRLDGRLEPRTIAATTEMFYEPLIEQCDLIAMAHGYRCDVLHQEDGWVHLGFTRLDAALSAPKEGPIHWSIGKVAEPNYMGDCEACGEPWPCLSAPKEGPGLSLFKRPADVVLDCGAGPYSIGSDTWPGLSKLIEECGEVMQVAGKIIATGGNPEHWDGTDLNDRIVEECGDLMAAIEFVLTHMRPWRRLDAVKRKNEKLALFQRWHREQTSAPTPDRCPKCGSDDPAKVRGHCHRASVHPYADDPRHPWHSAPKEGNDG